MKTIARHDSIIVLAALALLSGCQFVPGTEAYYRHEARLALADHVLDIDTAKLTRLTHVKGGADGGIICGSVNGRNEFNAYAGTTPFAVRERDKLVALALPQIKPTEEMARIIATCTSAKVWG